MSSHRKDPFWHSKQPVDVIEFMNLREHDSATEIGARRVHVSIVLVRVPFRQIFPDDDPGRDDISHGSFLEQSMEVLKARVKPQLVADEADESLPLCELDEFVGPVQNVGQGLLNKKRATCRRRLHRHG